MEKRKLNRTKNDFKTSNKKYKKTMKKNSTNADLKVGTNSVMNYEEAIEVDINTVISYEQEAVDVDINTVISYEAAIEIDIISHGAEIKGEDLNAFKAFLVQFRKLDDFYIPKVESSSNFYRHFGIKKEGLLWLSFKEILYLFDKTLKISNPEIKAYFQLKNHNFNVLLNSNEEQLVYKKRKHFNRKTSDSIAELMIVGKEEEIGKYLYKMDSIKNKALFDINGVEECCFVEGISIKNFSNKPSDNNTI